MRSKAGTGATSADAGSSNVDYLNSSILFIRPVPILEPDYWFLN